MKNEKLLNAIGEIDDELVLGAVNDIKEKDRRRKKSAGTTKGNDLKGAAKTNKRNSLLKWTAIAACLCVAATAAFVILNPPWGQATPDSNADGQSVTESIADYPAMIMIDGSLYYDSGETLSVSGPQNADGEITSSVEGEPNQNNQSNFGTGYSYRRGTDNTIQVCIDGVWHLFLPLRSGTDNSSDRDDLSQQEKEEMDPTYNGQD